MSFIAFLIALHHGREARTCAKKAYFRLSLGAAPRLPLGLRPAGVLPLGAGPPRLSVGLWPAGVLPLGAAPRLSVGLRPAVVLPLAAAPRPSVGLRRPAGVLPLDDVPPCCRCPIAHCFLLV